jgi:hypothetical protein
MTRRCGLARDIRRIFCHCRGLNVTSLMGPTTMQKNARAKSQRTRANKRKGKLKAWRKRQRKRSEG